MEEEKEDDFMEPFTEEDLVRYLVRERIERHLIYETLKYSYSTSLIIRWLSNKGYKYTTCKNNVLTIRFMLNEDNKKRYEELNRKLDNFYGWYHGASVINGVPIENKVGFFDVIGGFIILQYEPKFDVKQSTVPDKIYHLTLLQKLEKILNQGLTVRSSEQYFNFKDRIYFSNNIESLFFLSPQKDAQNEKEEDE